MFAILGPTASGKSALALALARHLGGTVVNGDPFQAYAGLPIGTGQPSPEDQHAVPHVGYGALPLSVSLNPGNFGSQVREWLAPHPCPVLVTGSGLYLRGIWDQMDELPEVSQAITDRTRMWMENLGAPALHRYLRAVDPPRAAQLHPNDRSRIQRALALHLATQGRASDLLSRVPKHAPEGWKALLVMPSREHLRERIARRVRAMIREGWPEEVDRIVQAGHEADLRRIRPLGYVNWLERGQASVETIAERITTDTQAYAKRQVTWFKNQLPDLPVWDPDTESVRVALERIGL